MPNSIKEIKEKGYEIYKRVSIGNRQFFPVKKDNETVFLRYHDGQCFEIDDWDKVLISDHFNLPTKTIDYNHIKIKMLISKGYKLFNTIAIDEFKYLPLKKNNKFFFYKQIENDYTKLTTKDKYLLKSTYGISAKNLPSRAYAMKIAGIVLVVYIAATNTGIIPDSIVKLTSLENYKVITGLTDIVENNQKAKEAIPFFDHFNKVINTYLSDFNILKDKEEPRILITPKGFKADESVAVAYYRVSDNTVHIRLLNYLTYAITHELIHWRTSDFIKKSNYGTAMYEAMTVLVDTELFGYINNETRRTTEDWMLKAIIESIGVENTLHPFLNNQSIKDISKVIDETMNTSGYGENMFKTMDKFRLNNINNISSTDLRDSQIKIIDLYFKNLSNITENETDYEKLTESIRACFRLKAILTTNHSHNIEFQRLNLELSDVLDYYEKNQKVFLDTLTAKYPFLTGTIKIMELTDRSALMNYFNEKRYIYHGEYVAQYYIHEVLLIDGETNYFIQRKNIPIHDEYNKDVIIYRKSSREMNDDVEVLITTSYAYDNINNYEEIKELIINNPDGILMGYIVDEFGNLHSSFKTNATGETLPLNIEKKEIIEDQSVGLILK